MKFFIKILFLSLIFSNDVKEIKKHQIGIFSPYQFQLTEEIEVSTHPIAFAAIPNIAARIKHNKKFVDFVFAASKADTSMRNNNNSFFTNHSIYIPTTLFNMLKREGMGGVISPELDDFPFMISLKNEVEIFIEREPYEISIKTGITFGYSSKNIDTRSTIDLPIIFPRMQMYYSESNYNLNYYLGIRKNLTKRLDIFSNINGFVYPKSDNNFFVENKSLLIWKYSENTVIQIGYKLVYGEYPFGNMLHLLPFSIMPFPLIDIVWTW